VEVRIGGDGRPGGPGGDDEVGEVLVRSACVMRGYRGAPGATARTLRDGWLHTGDLGRIDERGLLRLAGRADDTYIRGGYNVHPLEVEAVLAGMPGVAEVVVVPRPHEVLGQVGVAVVVPRADGPEPSLDALRSGSSGRLARWKLPEDLLVVPAVPRTAMGKVDRRALAARVATPTPGPRP
jgi:acyl-CoA synthetase (AMP-forming)/AMP-acid ligase II